MSRSQQTPVTDRVDSITSRLAEVVRPVGRLLARQPLLILGLILALTFGIYAQAINDWFQTDDFLLLRGAKAVPFLTYVREAFDFRDFEPLRLFAYRPLAFITTDVLYITFGLDPAPYHLLQIAAHMLNVVLVWHIARRMTRSLLVANLAALVFAIHPIYSQTVIWIAANNSQLALTGQLLSFVAFLEFSRRNSWPWLGASVVLYAIAILFHQEGFLLPLVLAIYWWFERGELSRDSIRSATGIFAPYGIVLLSFLAIQSFNANESGFDSFFKPEFALAETYAGALAMSAFPFLLAKMQWFHVLAAVVGVLSVGFAFVVNPQRRSVIIVAVVWYHVSLLLTLLFYTNLVVAVVPFMARKLYPAGPALAILIALVAEAFWIVVRPRLPAMAPQAALAIVVVLSALVVFRTDEMIDEFNVLAEDSQAFINGLQAEHPTLAEGDTLYVANAPLALVVFCTPGVLCYLEDAIYMYYGEVRVERVSVAELDSLQLGDDERSFCWLCAPARSD